MMLHRKIFVITLLLFLGGGLFVQAQTRVSGQVIDEQGEPIPFANVIFKNTHIGTVSFLFSLRKIIPLLKCLQ